MLKALFLLLPVLFCMNLCLAQALDKSLITEEFQERQITALPMTVEDLLSRYIRFPSVSGQEKEAGEFLLSVCQETGLHIRQFGKENGNFNFAASLYPLDRKKPNIVFLNHIDVVPAGDEKDWDYPPFEAVFADGEIHGRGAFDNKGAAVMQLAAIAYFVEMSRAKDLPYNVTLLSVSCEETSCEGGVRYVIEHHLADLNPFAVIGEGPPAIKGIISSDPEKEIFGISTVHKRGFWLKLELETRTNGHSSVTPLEYSNQEMVAVLHRLLSKKRKAIYTKENLALLKNLGRLEGGVKGFVLKNPGFFKPLIIPQLRKQPEVFALFANTITLTNLANPTVAHNVIPGKTTCFLDCRLLPRTDEDAFLRDLKKQLGHERIKAEVLMQTPRTEPSSTSHPVYQQLQRALKAHYGDVEVMSLILPNINDSGWFRAKGIPVFDVIPARVSREHLQCLHGNNERIPVTALHDGAEVFRKFLQAVLAKEN